jgi:hypothetical protein
MERDFQKTLFTILDSFGEGWIRGYKSVNLFRTVFTGSPLWYRGGETIVEDRLLSIEEAGEILNLSKDFLYRYWRQFSFAFKVRGQLRFSARGIQKWIEEQQHAGTRL